ncbi:unnamed protein product [Rotaria magnacalcarata]|uniref:Uncharacterized protein n=1 Tax=Rotaria magnacalcarata TaxID=392030 RepID=A0A816CEI5_9BILA|nr:unnamed protein product [Rotaria magnacalcarata]CAF4427108.1 unnamed protein product [Rotaria magnacalcarata]
MHFNAEAASQNKKTVQCYICLQYNHIAKYCKTKQQICAKCGDNHRIEQCTAANDAIKCNNCKGKHLATANDFPNFLEQKKRMLNLINQYSSTSSPTTTTPLLHDRNEFPSLPNMYQSQQGHLHYDIFDELINLLTTKMEKIIEETTKRLFETLINNDATSSSSFSDSDEDIHILQELLDDDLIECVEDDIPTFEINDYEAKLDWILGSQPLLSFITNVETHPTIGTINGHELLTFDITIGAEPKATSPRLSLNFKIVKWPKFRSKLAQQLTLWNNDLSLNSPLDIEDYSILIANSIMLATQEAVPTSTPPSKSYALTKGSSKFLHATSHTTTLFADYFENDVYSCTDDTLPFHDQVTSQASNIKNNNITFSNTRKWKQITIEEVKYHIKQLRNSSAGPGNIHNRCLKNSSELLIQHLTKLFNQILKQGYIPTK